MNQRPHIYASLNEQHLLRQQYRRERVAGWLVCIMLPLTLAAIVHLIW